jgi:hypothetical protein
MGHLGESEVSVVLILTKRLVLTFFIGTAKVISLAENKNHYGENSSNRCGRQNWSGRGKAGFGRRDSQSF